MGIRLDPAVQHQSGSGQKNSSGQWKRHTSEKMVFCSYFLLFFKQRQVWLYFQCLIRNVDTSAVGLSSLKNAECCNVNIPLLGVVCFGIMENRGQQAQQAGHFCVAHSAK